MNHPMLFPDYIKLITKEQEFINQQSRLGQIKNDLVHEINILKCKQNKLIEDQKIYESDLKLYTKLYEYNKYAITPNIPFAFENKYKIFAYLDKKNIMSNNSS